MNKLNAKWLGLFFLMFFLGTTASSQILFGLKKSVNGSTTIPFDVVSINPYTGTSEFVVSTDSLIGVAAGATTYDQRNKKYICWGFSIDNDQELYVMDLDDSLTSILPIPSTNPIEMEYDLKTQKAYGLWYDGTNEHFGEINLSTGATTSIATLPNVQAVAIGNSTFDSNLGRYIFIGVDGSSYRLYTVDASDGSILSSPIIYQNNVRFSALEYDVNNDKLYALYQDIDSTDFDNIYFNYYTELKFAEIDIATGDITIVNDTAVIEGYIPGYAVGGLCFDQLTQTYIIHVVNENGSFLKLVNALTGVVSASTSLGNSNYFYELQVDNYSYAVAKYSLSSTEELIEPESFSLNVYPNPANDYLKIDASEKIEELFIYNIQGQLVRKEFEILNNQININSLRSGNYLLIAKSANAWARQSFIKQ